MNRKIAVGDVIMFNYNGKDRLTKVTNFTDKGNVITYNVYGYRCFNPAKMSNLYFCTLLDKIYLFVKGVRF